ncbi:hypothetical protein HPB48_016633 [Haemaphysalis longicornis]|uniref:Uncharacterized protein n=1 Tax=Haemaphysalis longicornis TaxID=44386 RepID=A0A9J6GMB0_HAELO|nr:hypothetical protein HPB48_016633 [Haemaphysalis longicornis]
MKQTAVPSLLPKCPAYLSQPQAPVREAPEQKGMRLEAASLQEAILLSKQTKAEEEAKNKSDCSVLLDDLPNLQNSDFWTIINKDGRVFFLDFELPPAPAVCSSVIVSSGLRVQVFFSETHLNKCGYVLFPHTLCNLIDLKAVLHVVEEFQRNICTDPFQKMHYLLQLVATLLEEVSDEHVPSKL